MKNVAVFLCILGLILICVSFGIAEETSGKELYRSCAACHGENGESMALGVSKPLKGQTAKQILEKLNGYADETYGGSKKSVMLGIAKRMTEEDRKKVSEYISAF
ncbi:c-type cytochrome [Halodesulfovibrio marinisediminis]|uniref:Cytochrome c553 n=1 Tax=Halodesulfovibrio marinisediminis DSM 17456 TaxID=1121457 RepID=A0A1N6I514_9BACT|nr:c-type cytochrome [Halodesulfovibrio marinisediminis]SIO27124.1 Cytochrome c553 [Halodesulfovibrio marinisediminis DSM 17456]